MDASAIIDIQQCNTPQTCNYCFGDRVLDTVKVFATAIDKRNGDCVAYVQGSEGLVKWVPSSTLEPVDDMPRWHYSPAN